MKGAHNKSLITRHYRKKIDTKPQPLGTSIYKLRNESVASRFKSINQASVRGNYVSPPLRVLRQKPPLSRARQTLEELTSPWGKPAWVYISIRKRIAALYVIYIYEKTSRNSRFFGYPAHIHSHVLTHTQSCPLPYSSSRNERVRRRANVVEVCIEQPQRCLASSRSTRMCARRRRSQYREEEEEDGDEEREKDNARSRSQSAVKRRSGRTT